MERLDLRSFNLSEGQFNWYGTSGPICRGTSSLIGIIGSFSSGTLQPPLCVSPLPSVGNQLAY